MLEGIQVFALKKGPSHIHVAHLLLTLLHQPSQYSLLRLFAVTACLAKS